MSLRRKVQPNRRVAAIIKCDCGGQIDMQSMDLGCCDSCKREFFIWTGRNGKVIRPLDWNKDVETFCDIVENL